MRALIFAAGLGTRLKPITESIPKALVEVAGEPLLGHLIHRLKEAGFTEIVINVHHFAEKIIEYLRNNDDFGIKISISREEKEPLETGGGIKHAAKMLNDGEPFFVHNVDIISNLNIKNFCDSHYNCSACSSGASLPLATLLVSERKTSRYFVFDSDNLLCGWVNMESGLFKSPYMELKEEFAAHLAKYGTDSLFQAEAIEEFMQEHSLKKYAFAGTHIISPAIFQLMQEWPERFPIVDFYLANASRYHINAYIDPNLTLIDVGRPEHLPLAEAFLKKEAASL